MSNLAKNDEYSSDEEEESESEQEELPKTVLKGKVEASAGNSQEEEDDESDDDEDEEDSDTDNDAQRYNTVRREGNAAGAAKPVSASNPASKRGRDVEPAEQPASKKAKETKAERGRPPAVKPASPTKITKAEPAVKGGKAAAAGKPKPVPKAKPAPAQKEEKAPAAGRKRKAASPPINGATKQQTQKGKASEKSSPTKPKTPFTWTNSLEELLSTILATDKQQGRAIPVTKADPYWTKVAKEIEEGGNAIPTEVQISEKVRRIRNKYTSMKNLDVEQPWKNPQQEKLFKLWDFIWGTGKHQVALPVATAQGVQDEEDDEESSEDEGVATPSVKLIKSAAVPTREEESSDSEEDDEEPESVLKKAATTQVGTSKDVTVAPGIIVSPFVSKPRLEFTPHLPKDDKRKAVRKGEESVDEDREVPSSIDDMLNSLKSESLAVLEEVKASCMDVVNNVRKQSMSVKDSVPTPGMWRFGEPSFERGLLEDFVSSSTRLNGVDHPAAIELKNNWRQLRIEEMNLFEKRLQLTLKQLQLARKEFDEQTN